MNKYLITPIILLTITVHGYSNDFSEAVDLGTPTNKLRTYDRLTIYTPLWVKFFLEKDNIYEFNITTAGSITIDCHIFVLEFTAIVPIDQSFSSGKIYRFSPNISREYYFRITASARSWDHHFFLHYINTTPPTPTPTPTVTNTPQPTPPIPTPTFTPMHIPTFTSIPKLQPFKVFTIDSAEEFQHIPGGFTNPPLPGGDVFVDGIPIDPGGKSDGQGLMVVTSPGNVDLFMFPKIECGEDFVLLRGFVQASANGASIALVALDGSLDGSIATNIPANSSMFQGGYHRMLVLYDPPGDSVIPVFQVANTSGSKALVVYFDNLEVYRLSPGVGIPAELLADSDFNVNNNPTPTQTPIPDTKGQSIIVPISNLPAEAKPLEMVLIKSGTFTMGSPADERGRWEGGEWLPHQVTLTKDFYIGRYEVTQAQYQAIMGNNPSSDSGVGSNYPVYCVTWYDCASFCNRLSEREGLTPVYNESTWAANWNANGYRLPTEAEWEYACRAGTTWRFSHGDVLECDDECGSCAWHDQYMWWCGNAGYTSHEVGLKLPNPWGLYDMHGNVWEWCHDWLEYPSNRGPQVDPTGVNSGSYKVYRGGGRSYYARGCRSAVRSGYYPDYRYDGLGFRLSRTK